MKEYIEQNYDLQISDIKLLDEHFGTKTYQVLVNTEKYFVKALPLYFENVNYEGEITAYLLENGFRVVRLLKNKDGSYVTKTPEFQFTVQEYIEGDTLPINSAPDWFLEASAEFLGKTVVALKDYGELPLQFGKDFFSNATAIKKRNQYTDALARAKEIGDMKTIPLWKEQIRHLDRISKFQIDTNRLTYTNSHGDYHIGQASVKDRDVTVIDWTSACKLPIVLDVITSYVFACPSCADGEIDADGLLRYIQVFTKHFPLADYDIKVMPYVLYFWHCICNYRPDEISSIAPSYQSIASLVNKMLNWLYNHVEKLSDALVEWIKA